MRPGLCEVATSLMSPCHLESQGSCDKLKETGARGPPDNGIQGHACFARSKFLSLDTLKGIDRSAVLIPKTYRRVGGMQSQA